jgi:hypothetical protein
MDDLDRMEHVLLAIQEQVATCGSAYAEAQGIIAAAGLARDDSAKGQLVVSRSLRGVFANFAT